MGMLFQDTTFLQWPRRIAKPRSVKKSIGGGCMTSLQKRRSETDSPLTTSPTWQRCCFSLADKCDKESCVALSCPAGTPEGSLAYLQTSKKPSHDRVMLTIGCYHVAASVEVVRHTRLHCLAHKRILGHSSNGTISWRLAVQGSTG